MLACCIAAIYGSYTVGLVCKPQLVVVFFSLLSACFVVGFQAFLLIAIIILYWWAPAYAPPLCCLLISAEYAYKSLVSSHHVYQRIIIIMPKCYPCSVPYHGQPPQMLELPQQSISDNLYLSSYYNSAHLVRHMVPIMLPGQSLLQHQISFPPWQSQVIKMKLKRYWVVQKRSN